MANPEIDPAVLGIRTWPLEAKLRGNEEMQDRCRVPKPIHVFENQIRDVNVKLAEADCTPLLSSELLAARLYTG